MLGCEEGGRHDEEFLILPVLLNGGALSEDMLDMEGMTTVIHHGFTFIITGVSSDIHQA